MIDRSTGKRRFAGSTSNRGETNWRVMGFGSYSSIVGGNPRVSPHCLESDSRGHKFESRRTKTDKDGQRQRRTMQDTTHGKSRDETFPYRGGGVTALVPHPQLSGPAHQLTPLGHVTLGGPSSRFAPTSSQARPLVDSHSSTVEYTTQIVLTWSPDSTKPLHRDTFYSSSTPDRGRH